MPRRRMNPITRAKRAIARKTGIPTTKSGRVRKARRTFEHAATGGSRPKPTGIGCLTIVVSALLAAAALILLASGLL